MIIIAPLTSIIEDQLADLRTRGFRAAVLSYLNEVELEECSLEIILCSAGEAVTKEFTNLLKRGSSKFKAFAYHIILVGRVAIVFLSVENGEITATSAAELSCTSQFFLWRRNVVSRLLLDLL